MCRILHLSQNMYKPLGENGSTERIWQELSRDCEEYHILGRSMDNKFHNYDRGKIHLHTIPKMGRRNAWFALSGILVGKYIRRYKIDAVLSQCSVLGGLWAVCYGNRHGIPVMVEIHGAEYFRILNGHKIKDKLGGGLIRYSLNHASMVRALNEDMKQQLLNLGIKNRNIRVVYNRADFRLFNKPKVDFKLHDPIKIITVGTFSKLQGHDLIFDAIEHIKNVSNKFHITLIGGGDLFEHYGKRSNETGIPCEIRGRVPQAEIVELMSDCDIYIHPSYSEAVSRAIIEAMAMRMPIIVTDVGFTVGTVYDNESALVIPSGDSAAMADSILKLIDDEKLRRRLAEKAYIDAMENYEWNHCFDEYRKLLSDLLALNRKNSNHFNENRR